MTNPNDTVPPVAGRKFRRKDGEIVTIVKERSALVSSPDSNGDRGVYRVGDGRLDCVYIEFKYAVRMKPYIEAIARRWAVMDGKDPDDIELGFVYNNDDPRPRLWECYAEDVSYLLEAIEDDWEIVPKQSGLAQEPACPGS